VTSTGSDSGVRTFRTPDAVAWLAAHGHPSISANAMHQALSRARRARAAGQTGPHLFPEPDAPIDGRTPAWTETALAGWQPVGRGRRVPPTET
jgi:hypothetical protein